MRQTTIIIFLCFTIVNGFSQYLTYQLHNKDIGLDNVEISSLHYANNCLYIHSDKLYRFNGYSTIPILEFKNVEGRLVAVIPYKHGDIFLCHNSPAIYHSRDTTVYYPDIIVNHRNWVYTEDNSQVHFKSNNDIFLFDELSLSFSPSSYPYNLGIDTLSVTKYGYFNSSDTYISRILTEPKKMSIFQCSTQKETLIETDGIYYKEFQDGTVTYLYIRDSMLYQTNLVETDSTLLKSIDPRINPATIVSFSANQDLCTVVENEGTQRYYLEVARDGTVSSLGEVNHYFHDQTILGRSNVWANSHEGLYEVNPCITFFDPSTPGMINAIHSVVSCDDGSIYIGGYGEGITQYKDGKFNKVPDLISNLRENLILPGGLEMPDNSVMMITSGEKPFISIKNDIVTKRQCALEDGSIVVDKGYFIDTLQSGQLILGMQNLGLGLVQAITDTTLQIKTIGDKKGNLLKNVLTATEDHSGKIWMGRASKGVAVYLPEKDTAYTFLKNKNKLNIGVMSSDLDDQGNLWLGTTAGLYLLENPDKFDPELDDFDSSCRQINLPDGYQEILTVVKKWKNYLIICGKKAVYFVDQEKFYKDDRQSTPYINALFFGQDLEGDGADQNTIAIDKDENIWIGCQTGLVKINMSILEFDTIPIQIKIEEAKSGESQVLTSHNTIEVPSDNRNLQVTYGPISNPSLKRNIFFDYTLTNNSGDTLIADQYTQDCKVTLPYIPPDNYTLSVSARKNGIIQHTLTTKIFVPKTLLETNGFWIIITCTSVGLLYSIARAKNERLTSELLVSRLNQEKESLSVQAIISSFNPHFINNSLHWIQSRYRHDQALVSLVDKLSDNIRYIFLKTRQGIAVHRLSEELKIVQNYVAVQNLRFNNKIQLKLPNQKILTKYEAMNLILLQLQIHVENAIEHGLNNRKGSSSIEIEIQEKNRDTIISIIDDGGGRHNAATLQSAGTQQGSLMLDQLHNIFNQKNSRNMKTTYIDGIFSTTEGTPYGTKVSITIPKNYSYAL